MPQGVYILKNGKYEVRFFASASVQGNLAAAYIGPITPRIYRKWRIAKNTSADALWKRRIKPYLEKLVIAARKGEAEA